MADEIKRAAIWKRVTAAILDFVMLFFIGGFAIASLTGGLTSNGFKLQGAPSLVLLAIIAVYFFVCRRYAGGTLWDRIFRIQRPQPE